MAMSKTKRRPRSGVAEATRSRSELWREFWTTRLAASAAAWAERMPVAQSYQSTSVEPDELVPDEHYEPIDVVAAAKEATESRTAQRIVLARRPFNFGMAPSVHGRAYPR